MIDPERLIEALSEVDELDRVINEIGNFVRNRSIDPDNNQSITSYRGFINIINRARQVLERSNSVLFAYVFGSWAIGRVSPGSDVDIAIFASKELGWKDLVSMAMDLEDSLGLKVDLVYLNKAPLLLAYEVVSKGILILDRDPERRVDFEVRAIREFLDFKPRLTQYYDTVLNP